LIQEPIKVRKNKNKNLKKRIDTYTILGIPYYFILVTLIALPMFLIIMYSITMATDSIPFFKFTVDHFMKFFTHDVKFLQVLVDSLKFALITTLITILIGYPFAFMITKFKSKTQALLILIITVPMWINMFLRVIAWRQILQKGGIVHKLLALVGIEVGNLLGTDFAIIIGMVYVFLPFMIIPIYNVLNKIDPNLIQASKDLGANSFQTFKRVILPLSIPGVLSGVTMVMLPSATTLVIPKYLGQGKILIGNIIESQFIKSGDWNYGSAISIILALVIILITKLSNKLDKMREK
jgi:spermidine/putrescine transport system permease protein